MKVKLKGDESIVGEVADSILNSDRELMIVWNIGSYYRKSICPVSGLIFVVPAKYRRLENA